MHLRLGQTGGNRWAAARRGPRLASLEIAQGRVCGTQKTSGKECERFVAPTRWFPRVQQQSMFLLGYPAEGRWFLCPQHIPHCLARGIVRFSYVEAPRVSGSNQGSARPLDPPTRHEWSVLDDLAAVTSPRHCRFGRAGRGWRADYSVRLRWVASKPSHSCGGVWPKGWGHTQSLYPFQVVVPTGCAIGRSSVTKLSRRPVRPTKLPCSGVWSVCDESEPIVVGPASAAFSERWLCRVLLSGLLGVQRP